MADETYRGLLENISETPGTYKQMLQAIAEGGGGSGALILTSSIVDGIQTLDHTMQEIYDAFTNGVPVYFFYSYGTLLESYTAETYLAPVTAIYSYSNTALRLAVSRPTTNENVGQTYTLALPAQVIFRANSMSDYPEYFRTVYVPGSNCSLS